MAQIGTSLQFGRSTVNMDSAEVVGESDDPGISSHPSGFKFNTI